MEIQNSSPCSWQPPPPRRRERRRKPPHANTLLPSSTCEVDDGDRRHVELPQDVLQHIYSLMPMRDAARAACVSRSFLRFWRRYPNLTFNQETLAADRPSNLRWCEDTGKYVFRKTREVLERHSGGVGAKKLSLNLSACSKDDVDARVLYGWLRAFVRPGGVSELAVRLPECCAREYTFPYSVLTSLSYGGDADDDDEASGGAGTGMVTSSSSSVQSLYLTSCGFHPTTQQGPSSSSSRTLQPGCAMRSLSRVCLRRVDITDAELGFFLSTCLALERLELSSCDAITSLKIPRAARTLRVVRVQHCAGLHTVESDAPRLSAFRYDGRLPLLRFSLGDAVESKELELQAYRMPDMIQFAGSNLPCVAPNLETLALSSFNEKLKAPVMLHKFQKLKHLVICLGESGGFARGHDFVSLAWFLDACPALETFTLRIADGFAWYKKYVIVGKPDEEDDDPSSSQPQQQQAEIPGELRLGNLRNVTITGFCSAASLAELARRVLGAAPSLRCLTLDATPGYDTKRSAADRCCPMRVDALRDAERALAAARARVAPEGVPAGVELRVLGPCGRCHAVDSKKAMQEAGIPRTFLQRQPDGSVALVIVQPRNGG